MQGTRHLISVCPTFDLYCQEEQPPCFKAVHISIVVILCTTSVQLNLFSVYPVFNLLRQRLTQTTFTMHFNTLFTLAFAMLGLTAAVRRRQTPPPPGETYVTVRPACNISGFTQTPVRQSFSMYSLDG